MQTIIINDSDLLQGIYAVVDLVILPHVKKAERHSDWLYKFFSQICIDLYK